MSIKSTWRDNLQRIVREANAIGASKCGPAPHACSACEIRYLAEQLLAGESALLDACQLTVRAIREARDAGDEDDARLSRAYADLVINEIDTAIAAVKGGAA